MIGADPTGTKWTLTFLVVVVEGVEADGVAVDGVAWLSGADASAFVSAASFEEEDCSLLSGIAVVCYIFFLCVERIRIVK